MAWTYALSAECGPDRESPERFRLHFEQAESALSSGVRTRCVNGIHMDQFGNWWAIICPSGASRSGVTDVETAKQLSEVGALLYELLRTASDFRYAAVVSSPTSSCFFTI